jgi:hypothetical protein
MILRIASKSPSLPRARAAMASSALDDASQGCGTVQSVHAAGISDRLPFGRMTRTSSTLRRFMLLITASLWPSNAWHSRVIVTNSG